jgi:uncharacterized membrane protein
MFSEDASMKWLACAVTGVLMVALLGGSVGCTTKPGTSSSGEGGKKLTLKGLADVSIKEGETATISVDITRDKFTDPVELKFAGLPEGVSIVEKDLTLAKDVSTLKLTLKAAADAKAVDDHKVTVSASGGGMTPEATFKVSVKKKG